MMKQAHIVITGFVQGVGFRQFIKKESKKRNVSGWVRNVHNNRVEAVLQGANNSIEDVIFLCRKGPLLADVKDIVVTWEDQERVFEDFTVVS